MNTITITITDKHLEALAAWRNGYDLAEVEAVTNVNLLSILDKMADAVVTPTAGHTERRL